MHGVSEVEKCVTYLRETVGKYQQVLVYCRMKACLSTGGHFLATMTSLSAIWPWNSMLVLL